MTNIFEIVVRHLKNYPISSKHTFEEFIDIGLELSQSVNNETFDRVADLASNVHAELTPGSEVVTPAGLMIVPQERTYWIQEEAVELLRDSAESGETDVVEHIREEFNFMIGFTCLILFGVHNERMFCDRTCGEITYIISRSEKYRDDLITAIISARAIIERDGRAT